MSELARAVEFSQPRERVVAADRVCVVVVTFNRKHLLQTCLRSLFLQTHPVDEILVVNNASTDGTPEMLAQTFPQVRVLNLSRNTGGAGGFHAGIEWAHKAGFEWIWVMDDDIQIYPDTLEVMLRYKEISDFIHVRKTGPEGLQVWEGMWDLSSVSAFRFREDLSFKHGREWTSVTYGNFEGALIRRKVVEKIGYPDPRFFMVGDDTIYGFLASLHTNVIYINHVGIERKLPARSTGNRNTYYFRNRNRFLTVTYLKNAGAAVSGFSFWTYTLRDVIRCLTEILWTRRT